MLRQLRKFGRGAKVLNGIGLLINGEELRLASLILHRNYQNVLGQLNRESLLIMQLIEVHVQVLDA